jgi:predicted ATPase
MVLEGSLRLHAQAAGRHGAVVLLDDLQDEDPETLEFLNHAAGAAPAEPVFLVAAARVPEGRQVAAEAAALESRGLAAVFELTALSEAEMAAVVEAILGAAPPAGLVSEIAARTDGVPLFVEELLEAQLGVGALRVERGTVHWSGAGAARPAATTLDLVAEKLRRVGREARGVLLASALLGRFDPEVLSPVAGTDPLSVAASLREGVEVGPAGGHAVRGRVPARLGA